MIERIAVPYESNEGLIWQDLRATFGTRLAQRRVRCYTIAQLLGHADGHVTIVISQIEE